MSGKQANRIERIGALRAKIDWYVPDSILNLIEAILAGKLSDEQLDLLRAVIAGNHENKNYEQLEPDGSGHYGPDNWWLVWFPRPYVHCSELGDTGMVNPPRTPCPECNGTTGHLEIHDIGDKWIPCPTCHGTGRAD